MNRGFGFLLKSLFQPFLFGTVLAFLVDYLILFVENDILNFNVMSFDIYPVLLLSVFINVMFIKNNILNYLFINGCSRIEINNTKKISFFIYILMYFIAILVYEFLFGTSFKNIDLYKVLRLITIYISLNLVAEFAFFITLIYRKLSVEKGKGVNKFFYRFGYSFLFVIIAYTSRYLHKLSYFSDYFNNELVISCILLFCIVLEVVLIVVNKKHILKVDIRV